MAGVVRDARAEARAAVARSVSQAQVPGRYRQNSHVAAWHGARFFTYSKNRTAVKGVRTIVSAGGLLRLELRSVLSDEDYPNILQFYRTSILTILR